MVIYIKKHVGSCLVHKSEIDGVFIYETNIVLINKIEGNNF